MKVVGDNMNIPFSPPDIQQEDINEVISVLKSGWITTGPKTKEFEINLANYIGTSKVVCLNSATAGLELALRILGIGPGDEVITSAYTYTASASIICHVGAIPILVDIPPNSCHIDAKQIEKAITTKTKAIITVDLAGIMCDYDSIIQMLESKKHMYQPKKEIQQIFHRIPIIADASHALGATYKGLHSGNVADFTVFSFHAVKNLTTAEGGAVTWKKHDLIDDDELHKLFMLHAIHGQTKDALSKSKLGGWEYDILFPAYKYNMTDISAALGVSQLRRYDAMLTRREEIVKQYNTLLEETSVTPLPHISTQECKSSCHLYMLQLEGFSEPERNHLIERLSIKNIGTNVHYKPLPLLTAYKNLGFQMQDYPNSYAFYVKEITLPLYSQLTDEQCHYICSALKTYRKLM